ncbi:methylglyoxal reductase (NADPH-dependent) gre2 [Tulasnella sp. 403]|nr:methylglyoxal reductase (NADPH-dependent) gre2 [Tulasnella sp. 403]
MPSVLVTGAEGFLGFHTVKNLLNKGYDVVGTVRSERRIPYLRNTFQGLVNQLELIVMDNMATPGAFDSTIQERAFDAVFHIGAPFAPTINDIARDLSPAIQGTTSILESVRAHGPTVKRVMITSSFAAVLDPRKNPRPGYAYTEDDRNPVTYEEGLMNLVDGYYASKTLAEKAAWDFLENEKPHFALTTFCLPMVCGPPEHEIPGVQHLNSSAAVIYNIFNGTSRNHGNVYLWVDVRDVALAHTLALGTEASANQRYLLTAGNVSTQHFLDHIWRHYTERAIAKNVFRGTPGVPNWPEGGVYSYDNSKSRRDLGIEYRGFDAMLAATIRHEMLHEHLKGVFPYMRGFRMTRHPTNPSAIIEFDRRAAAKDAVKDLRQRPILVEGRVLRASIFLPRSATPHRTDRVSTRSQTGRVPVASSTSDTSRPASPSIYIRYKGFKRRSSPDFLRSVLAKMQGFQHFRFRRSRILAGFADFDSIDNAKAALNFLRGIRSIDQNFVIAFAPSKISRSPSRTLHLRTSWTISPGLVKRRFQRFEGFRGVTEVFTSSTERRYTIAFETEADATHALHHVRPPVPLRPLFELSYFWAEQRAGPSHVLFLRSLSERTTHTALVKLFCTYPGYRRTVLAKAPGFRVHGRHAAWGLVEFETPEDAEIALLATHGKLWKRSTLSVYFWRKRVHPTMLQPTNVLFCTQLFGITPDAFRSVFSSYKGFQHSQICVLLYIHHYIPQELIFAANKDPDRRGGAMPYGKITFNTVADAVLAYQDLQKRRVTLGHGELPIVVRYLRLRKTRRRGWKPPARLVPPRDPSS